MSDKNPRTLTLPPNTQGRDFVVGDIHGAFDLLDQALLAVNFDPANDRLIAVGDLVDRGSRSADCLYYLAQPWFHSIRGNHEELFMWLYQNGELNEESTVKNLRNGVGWILLESNDTLDDIRSAFEKLPIAIEIETPEGLVGFVHADIPPGMDWKTFKKKIAEYDASTEETALWSRKRICGERDKDDPKAGYDGVQDHSGVAGIARVFFGHTVVDDGPKALGNCFFIDTGAVFKLTGTAKTESLYLTLVDIRANAEDILNPAPTSTPIVRTATVTKNNKITPPAPSKPFHPPAP